MWNRTQVRLLLLSEVCSGNMTNIQSGLFEIQLQNKRWFQYRIHISLSLFLSSAAPFLTFVLPGVVFVPRRGQTGFYQAVSLTNLSTNLKFLPFDDVIPFTKQVVKKTNFPSCCPCSGAVIT